MLLSDIQSSDFVPCLHEIFRVSLEGLQPIDLELVEVQELGEPQGPTNRKPFVLHFLGPVSDQYLVQHSYALRHERLGTLEIFLVPLGPQGGRMQYEAIFT